MKKILFILLLTLNTGKAEKIYYLPEDFNEEEYNKPAISSEGGSDDGYDFYYGSVIFSDYNDNNDYVVILDVADYGLEIYVGSNFMDNVTSNFYLLNFYCIKPNTAIKAPKEALPFNRIDNLIGERDETCDCSNFKFTNVTYPKNSFTGKCEGYKEYTLAELKTFKGKFRFK
jgi:hypothetical protein